MGEMIRWKILVIDDSRTHLQFAQAALAEAGFDVSTQSTPVGTVVRVIREHPDLVLLDINMPGLSGTSLATVIKKQVGSQATRVMLYSDLPMATLAARAAACTADGYVSKSVDKAGLVQAVVEHLPRAAGA